MEFTEKVVDDLADKLLIGLTREENKMVLDEFNVVDSDMSVLTKIPNIDEVEPMTHCLDNFEYTLREDVVEESTPIDDLLKNSDVVRDREIEVPRMVG